jgi:hypothetical protein
MQVRASHVCVAVFSFVAGGLVGTSEDPGPPPHGDLVSLIDGAEDSIRFLGPDPGNVHVAYSLIRAHARGVDVEVVVAGDRDRLVAALERDGVRVRIDDRSIKGVVLVVDGACVTPGR